MDSWSLGRALHTRFANLPFLTAFVLSSRQDPVSQDCPRRDRPPFDHNRALGRSPSSDQSFPEHENGFQVGMRLEGIDPRHPSVFCVLSVAEVCGYRLRLHFDGYLSCYDFWTNAGSPDIHPVGWCEKTKHELHIPKVSYLFELSFGVLRPVVDTTELKKENEDDEGNITYLPTKEKKYKNGPMPKEFQVGMKLEAVDRKNPSLVCVATIADIVEDRLLVHFDNWDDSYDYWCDVNSPYVQPVGWCQENGRTLIAPQVLLNGIAKVTLIAL
ncbi:hypothetical protein GH733_001885 [Mirounga leonina]|nr:hypothetical protein GH733_001885 [Mirounga leonina]